jgi:hypothetical protein
MQDLFAPSLGRRELCTDTQCQVLADIGHAAMGIPRVRGTILRLSTVLQGWHTRSNSAQFYFTASQAIQREWHYH